MRSLPAARRSRKFVLTPLIDVIFLLLVFFMLSSRLAPYSLLPISEAAPVAAEATAAAALGQASGDRLTPVLFMSQGRIRIDGRSIVLAELPPAIAALQAGGTQDALLVANRSATAQDLATVLEAFRAASFPHLRLARRPAGLGAVGGGGR